jgi:hypothetical protein
MPFVVPQFPLTVNFWRVNGTGKNYAAPDVQTIGNLSPGRRVMISLGTTGSFTTFTVFEELLLPLLTDVRMDYNGILPDLVECPAASGRFYNVVFVVDIGKGFANEHRMAVMQYLRNGAVPPFGVGFPVGAPVPLP